MKIIDDDGPVVTQTPDGFANAGLGFEQSLTPQWYTPRYVGGVALMSQYGYSTEPPPLCVSSMHGSDEAADVGTTLAMVEPAPLQSGVVNVVIDHAAHVDMSG